MTVGSRPVVVKPVLTAVERARRRGLAVPAWSGDRLPGPDVDDMKTLGLKDGGRMERRRNILDVHKISLLHGQVHLTAAFWSALRSYASPTIDVQTPRRMIDWKQKACSQTAPSPSGPSAYRVDPRNALPFR